MGYYDHITAVEIREEEKKNLKDSGSSEIEIEDFLNFNPTRKYQTIITNPPYSLAQKIIENVLKYLIKTQKLLCY